MAKDGAVMFGFGKDKDKDQQTGETQKSHGIKVAKVSIGSHKNPESARLWDDSAQYDPEQGRERWIIPVGTSKVIDLEGLTAVDVFTMSGRIDVIGHEGSDARLEITNVKQDEVRVGLVDGRLIIAHPQADGRMHEMRVGSLLDVFSKKGFTDGPSVDVSLVVPREVALRVDCVSGDTLASGLTGNVSLDTVSGSVLANGLSGKVKLDAVSGQLEARNHHGRVTANSVSGDVIVSGDCEKITMDSVNGHLYVDAFGRPRKISVDGVSATATIRLDHDIHAKYRVDGVHAKVVIDGAQRKTKFGDGFNYEEGPADAPLTKIHADGVNIKLNVTHRDPATGVAGDEDGSAADWARAFASESAESSTPASDQVVDPASDTEREA